MTPASPPASLPSRGPQHPLSFALSLGALVFLVQVIFWRLSIQHDFFPTGDEFSLLTHSTRVFHASPLTWFTHGFADYFNPYPDLALPYSNFLRPLDNLVFYLNSLLFTTHWSFYLLANYLLVSLVVALAFYLAHAILDLSLALSLLIAAATIVSPAFTAQIFYRPSFAFDYLAAVFVLLTAALLARGRLLPAWFAVCCAVFSKEPGFFTSGIAFIAVFYLLRQSPMRTRILRSVAFLLPLAAMFLLRLIDFSNLRGVYVASTLSPLALAKNIILGLTHWPYMLPGEQHIFDRTFHNFASLGLSLLLWILVLAAIRILLRPILDPAAPTPTSTPSTADARAILCLFFLGSLLLPLLFDLTPRFGAATLPLFFMTLGCLAQQAPIPLRRLALAVLLLITVVDLFEARKIVSPETLAVERNSWTFSRDLVRTLSHTTSPVVFLVDDFSESFASPENLARFTGYRGQLIPISNLAIGLCAHPPTIHVTQLTSREYTIDSAVPESCGSNALLGAYRLDRLSGPTLDRDLPTAHIVYHAFDRPTRKEEFLSQHMTIDLTARVPAFAILAPDLTAKTYVDVTQHPRPANP
jgi:hypothetical protein